MNRVTRREVTKLIGDPISFAMLMEDWQLEKVIVAFVAILNKRKSN